MATDMDIEMDIDIGLTEEDLMIPEVEIIPDSDVVVSCLEAFDPERVADIT